jgi:hypothetical protein
MLQGENRERTECPLCESTHEDRTDLVFHLQVDHSKSEMAATLAETSSGREIRVR